MSRSFIVIAILLAAITVDKAGSQTCNTGSVPTNMTQLVSVAGDHYPSTTDDEVCCALLNDPARFAETVLVSLDLEEHVIGNRDELIGPDQEYSCSISTHSNDTSSAVLTVGKSSNCRRAPLVTDFRVEDGLCNEFRENCTARLIFQVKNTDNVTCEEYLYDEDSTIVISDFEEILVHYEICGCDVLSFNIPISATHPMSVSCSPVSAEHPARVSGQHMQCPEVTTTESSLPTTASSENSSSPVAGGSKEDSDGTNDIGAIIGGVVGALALVLMVMAALYFIRWKKNQTRERAIFGKTVYQVPMGGMTNDVPNYQDLDRRGSDGYEFPVAQTGSPTNHARAGSDGDYEDVGQTVANKQETEYENVAVPIYTNN